MKNSFLRIAAIAAAVFWLFLVTFNYYIVNKPFTGDNALAITNTLGNVLIVVVLYALAAAIGRRLTRRVVFASPLEALVFSAGIGLGTISLTVFVLGLAGLLYRVLFWALVVLGVFLMRDDLRDLLQNLRALRLPIDSRFERGLMWFVVTSLVLAFLVALTPTLAWDAQLYHLLEAKVALAQGRIGPPPDIPSMSYPSFVEMLYLAAMLLKDDGATPVIHLGFTLLTVGALLAFSQRFFSARVGWCAVAILLAVPSYLLVATWPYNDAALAFYVFVAFYAVVVANENLDRQWLILAGACAGMALGMKYTALDIPLALMIVLWLARRVPLRRWLWILVPCVLVGAPWYLRNWIFMGNPVYPFFLGGRYWDSFRNSLYSLFGTGLINEPWRILIAPWEASILGQEGKAMYEATIGPLLLAGLPLLILVWRNEHAATTRAVLRNCLIFSVTLYVFWLAGMTASRSFIQSRLLFPAFPALVLMVAIALDRLPALDLAQFSLARFARLWVAFVLGLTLLGQALNFVLLNPLPYLAGFETREHYLANRLSPNGYWQALEFLGRLPSPKVIFLWEPRAYYAPDSVVVQPDEILDVFAHLRYQFRDAAAIANALRARGYQYILLNRWGLEFQLSDRLSRLTTDDLDVLQELLSHHARQVYGTLPFDYMVDGTGKPYIYGADTEAYAVYALNAE